MPAYAQRVATFGTTIFTEINVLAQQYHALNLGQGKPDFDTPPDIVEQLGTGSATGLTEPVRARTRHRCTTQGDC